MFAYWDKNENLIYDAGEPAGQYGEPKMVAAPAGGVISEINVAIVNDQQAIALPHGFEMAPEGSTRLHSRLAGAIVPLDDERFSPANGHQGFWEPVTFFKALGGSINF